ncbi:hypothetical protein GWI33_022865 [Rhynchophorus ferrugineus]|uniref:Uncharacterized protein n=1 Tax=Rhynchophorus ferrugineus TaxID=354439 RepID=A0A834MH74_RHYFE|nr:hypothetical protein GWI33_022865 [Rhynchophorus ferrugineus]
MTEVAALSLRLIRFNAEREMGESRGGGGSRGARVSAGSVQKGRRDIWWRKIRARRALWGINANRESIRGNLCGIWLEHNCTFEFVPTPRP